MTAFLASVRNLDEAKIAYRAGADWIDLKEPANGALGAVASHTIVEVVQWIQGQEREVSLSATIGDCWETPSLMPSLTARLFSAGVEYAKIGLFGASPGEQLLETIKECCRIGPRIILVCFAEDPPSPGDIRKYAACGIAGVMLDTANKAGPDLTALLSSEELGVFVRAAHRHGLICGLAGSLKAHDIEKLSWLQSDYLGFRGALCCDLVRESDFSLAAATKVRAMIDAASNKNGERQAGQADAATDVTAS